jgi:hypothetical protein
MAIKYRCKNKFGTKDFYEGKPCPKANLTVELPAVDVKIAVKPRCETCGVELEMLRGQAIPAPERKERGSGRRSQGRSDHKPGAPKPLWRYVGLACILIGLVAGGIWAFLTFRNDPVIIVDGTVNYGLISVAEPASQQLHVANHGKGTLKISSIKSSSSAYIPARKALDLAQDGEDSIEIRFAPVGGGDFPAELKFESNDRVTKVAVVKLQGSAAAIAPWWVWDQWEKLTTILTPATTPSPAKP